VFAAVTFVGAAGTVAAAGVVIGSDGAEGELVPTAFVAVTVNVYAVSGANPVTTHEASVAPVVVHVCPPVELVTVYPVIALMPSSADRAQATFISILPSKA
jgi:hypothetical protein